MKCPRKDCKCETDTQLAAYSTQQAKLDILRAHSVIVHIVDRDNLVFICTGCEEDCWPGGWSVSSCVEDAHQRCKSHRLSCGGAFQSLGPGRRVKL
jgi:hypothetical protein